MNHINTVKPKTTKPITDNILINILKDLQKKIDFTLQANDFAENLKEET